MQADQPTSYSSPVDKLLTYGDARLGPANWPDYLELGFGPEHIPDLIRMATDEALNTAETEDVEVWAPAHAWRTLGQLHAEAAIKPLLDLLEEPWMEYDDWFMEELPEVIAMIGPVALPLLAEYLADLSRDEDARINVTTSVRKIAEHWPDAREQSVALLMGQLEKFDENEPDVNGFLVLALVDLKAQEAAPLIKRAFDADAVDPMIMGDWDDVQVELGLKSGEEVAQKRASTSTETLTLPGVNEAYLPHVSSETSRKQEAVSHKKTKSKMAKQSRKKNRKR